MPPQTIAESATLNTGQTLPSGPKTDRKSTTPPRRKPGVAEDPVDQVAERAAEDQAEGDRPAGREQPARRPHDDDGDDDRDQAEHDRGALGEGERGADVAQLGQVERAAEQADVLARLDGRDHDQLGDQVGQQDDGGEGEQQAGPRRRGTGRGGSVGRIVLLGSGCSVGPADDDNRRRRRAESAGSARPARARRPCRAAAPRSTARWPAARGPWPARSTGRAERFTTQRNAGPRSNARTSSPRSQPGQRGVVQRRQPAAQPQRRPVERQRRRRVGHAGRPRSSAAHAGGCGSHGGDAVGGEAERRAVARPTAAAPGSRRGPGPCGRSAPTSGPGAPPPAGPRPPAGPAPRPGRRRRSPGSARVSSAAARARRRPSAGSVGAARQVSSPPVAAPVSARPKRVTWRVSSWLESTQVAGAPTVRSAGEGVVDDGAQRRRRPRRA